MPALLAAGLFGTLSLGGCRKPAPPPDSSVSLPLTDKYHRNQLADAPTDFLRRYADAPVHWQPLTHETTRVARESKRMMFVYVGSSL